MRKNNKKKIIIFCLVIILAICWVWRYTSLNSYYQSLSDQTTVCFPSGEKVPFGTDYLEKDLSANGYWLQVNDFAILDYGDYTATLETKLETLGQPPEKIALVYVTLYNENSNEDGVMLTELTLHGHDSYAGMNWYALLASNPVLEGNYGINLAQGSSYDLILPYSLFASSFSSYTWNRIDEYDFYLRITFYPTAKDIQVQ